MKAKSINYTIGAIALAIILGCGGGAGGVQTATLNKIYYASDETSNFEIFTINPDGTNKTQITASQAGNQFVAGIPSGDGSQVVVGTGSGTTAEIGIITISDSSYTALTNNSTEDTLLDVDRQNRRILFLSRRDGNPNLYTMNFAGGSIVKLTNSGADKFDARFNANGSHIIFCNSDTDADIFSVSSNALNTVNLTPSTTMDTSPRLRPDGSKILYQCGVNICTMNLNGTGQVALTSGTNTQGNPEWSPNGSKIVFSEVSMTTAGDIWIMDANGANKTALTSNNANEIRPIFSRDGSLVIFTTELALDQDIYTVLPDGTGRQAIADTANSIQNVRAF